MYTLHIICSIILLVLVKVDSIYSFQVNDGREESSEDFWFLDQFRGVAGILTR